MITIVVPGRRGKHDGVALRAEALARYCSKHDPDGPATRACMNANGAKLSNRCVNALVSAGEISKAEVTRRTAAATGK